ncbi:MAG TPA: glycosyltransferase family 2 protein, partial [Phnomibacter sp.]|nr:glycosyltransferase family 2 protein [Phnomibacter sp.]
MQGISVVIPCLNEARTIGTCIQKAQQAISRSGLAGEVLVADNGSTDGSATIAHSLHARVVPVPEKGYGAALHTGISQARYDWVLFADADESYDFTELERFIPPLQAGAQLVVGNRFAGGIAPGAMPWLHRYLGTPVISFIGRRSFGVTLTDFNCGMRALHKPSYLQLSIQSPGMEYASEMIAKAALHKWTIAEVPVSLHKDNRGRKPHLKTWSDGWKHLRLILLLSPKWLLLIPALIFLTLGLGLGTLLVFSYIKVFNLILSIHTLYYASVFVIIALQLLQFYVIARLYGHSIGLYPARRFASMVKHWLSFEKGLLLGGFLLLTGLALS